MWRIRLLLLRLVNTIWRGRAERQLSREVDAHLAILEEDYRRRGLSPEAARLAARREFGGVEQAKEVQRDARGVRWLADAWRDVGYALRTLRRAPGFTAVAVITLGLGIGAATVIYSVVRNVVLDPFPYAHSDRLVDVLVRDASGGLWRGALPPGEFLDYVEQSDVFEDVAGANGQSMHLVSEAGAERVSVVLVTPNTFTYRDLRLLRSRLARDARRTRRRASAGVIYQMPHRFDRAAAGAAVRRRSSSRYLGTAIFGSSSSSYSSASQPR